MKLEKYQRVGFPSFREILATLDKNGWHAGRTCRALRIGRATLWRRLSARGISLRGRKKRVWSEFSFFEKISQHRVSRPEFLTDEEEFETIS
jgi:hypothetical protein